MYFILSKILLFLLYPILWVLVLIVLALLVKDRRRKQRFLIIAVILIYFFSAPLFIKWFAHAWSIKSDLPRKTETYSSAIVLGGFSSTDKNNNGFFNGACDRFIEGLKVFNTGEVKHILVSGGNGMLNPNGFKEASWVKTQLQSFKVPDSSILIESNSRNTIENAIFSKELLRKDGLKPPYLLITSDFHMRRAYMIFKKEGLQVVPYTCDFSVGKEKESYGDLIPDGSSWGDWNLYLKELVGYVVDKYKKN
ncbi:MAG: YdcF family protein [Sphingobacteriales bacterium]